MKICSNIECSFDGIPQSLESFSKDKYSKDRLRSRCKTCDKEYCKTNKDKIAKQKQGYYLDNKKIINKRNKEYYEKNKEEISKHSYEYNQQHKMDKKEYDQKYYQNNKKEKKEYQQLNRNSINNSRKKRSREDINFRIACNLRSRLCAAIKGNFKSGSAVRDMGCSIDEMFKMFEPMYENNPLHPILGKMCRKNYGRINGVRGWEIDHIIPLSAFDLSDREQLLKAVHYSNLRPMWSEQNSSEGARGMSLRKKKKGRII